MKEPPKVVSQHLVAHAPKSAGLDTRAHGSFPVFPADANADSFPVLRAFHEFLAFERRRAKRRMTFFALAVLGIFLAASGLTILVSVIMVRHLKQDYEDARNGVLACVRESAVNTRDIQAALARLREEAAQARNNTGQTQDDPMDDTAVLPESQPANETGSAAAGADRLLQLEAQIAELETTLSNRMAEGLAAPPPATASLKSDIIGDAGSIADGQVTMVQIRIRPPGITNAVTWRVPIP